MTAGGARVSPTMTSAATRRVCGRQRIRGRMREFHAFCVKIYRWLEIKRVDGSLFRGKPALASALLRFPEEIALTL